MSDAVMDGQMMSVVAMHSGNMGNKQDLGNVIDAARLAGNREDIRFVLMGDGSQRAALARQAQGLDNVAFLPPAPENEYADLLAAADILLLNERATVKDMSLPSKLTSYFRSGSADFGGGDRRRCSRKRVARCRCGCDCFHRGTRPSLHVLSSCAWTRGAVVRWGCPAAGTQLQGCQRHEAWISLRTSCAWHLRRSQRRRSDFAANRRKPQGAAHPRLVPLALAVHEGR